VIVYKRERETFAPTHGVFAFEIHLGEFVRLLTLESQRRFLPGGVSGNEAVANKHAMNGRG
jgi:hypothetical protein